MLEYTQILILELGSKCNLTKEHPKCPISKRPIGDRELDDDTIIRLAKTAYNELGFTGMLGFHYYNEPMLQWKRMLNLIDEIRKVVPQSRFILWTNGTILIDDKRFDNIEKVFVTDYYNQGVDKFKPYYRNNLDVIEGLFDRRLLHNGVGSSSPCARPFLEFIISTYGDVVLCCQDWENNVKIGNVFDTSLKELSQKKLDISLKIAKFIDKNNPTCYYCKEKWGSICIDEKTYSKTNNFLMSKGLKHDYFYIREDLNKKGGTNTMKNVYLEDVILGIYTHRTTYITNLLESIRKYTPNIPILIQMGDGSIYENMSRLREHFLNQNRRYWVFLDDDIEFLREDIIETALTEMIKYRVALIGVYETFSDEVAEKYLNDSTLRNLFFKYTDWIPGYFMMVDSKRLKNIEFDPNIPGNTGVDMDYSFNAKKLGYKIGISSSIVKHRNDKYKNGNKPFNTDETNIYLKDKWKDIYNNTTFCLNNTIEE